MRNIMAEYVQGYYLIEAILGKMKLNSNEWETETIKWPAIPMRDKAIKLVLV